MIKKRESEHSPLSAWDEFPVHQTTAPLRVVDTTDPRAYERYWFSVQDRGGAFILQTGIGFYPNLGIVDAYAAWNYGNLHTTVRAHRYLNDARQHIECGPFIFEVVEPFREWRLRLKECGQGMLFDIRFLDTKRAVFHTVSAGAASNITGRLNLRSCGYETFGVAEGNLTLDGQTFKMDKLSTCGSRDHHWGERNGVGGTGFLQDWTRKTHFGQWVEFKDWALWGERCLFNFGDPRHPVAVMSSDRELEFDPLTDHFIGGKVTNRLANGQTKVIHYEQIDDKVIYLRTGLYMGADFLGSPDGNLFHGSDVGESVVDRVTYDLRDPKTRIRIGGFEDHLVRATCDGEETIGLIEVMNPVPFEWATQGKRGYRLACKD